MHTKKALQDKVRNEVIRDEAEVGKTIKDWIWEHWLCYGCFHWMEDRQLLYKAVEWLQYSTGKGTDCNESGMKV